MPPRRILLYFLALVGLIAANVFVYKAVTAPAQVTATVIQAGEGRVILIQTADHQTLLVDTGPDASILRALGTSLPIWKRNITMVALTSTDGQSKGGLPSLADRYAIGETIRYGTEAPYGIDFTIGDIQVIIPSPHMVTLVYKDSMRTFASTTLPGVYPL